MNPAVGLAVTLRVRIGASDVVSPAGTVEPSRLLALFSDIAAELMIRVDGDEGVLRGFQQIDLLAPVFVGDYVEATGVLTKMSGASRQFVFEARKVVSYLRSANAALTAADALASPTLVCRAMGSGMVARPLQRRPKLVLPALPGVGPIDSGKLPMGSVIITPPPHVVVTPARETPPEIVIAASIIGGGVTRDHTPHVPLSPEEVANEVVLCRNAGASVIYLGLDHQRPYADSVAALRDQVAAARAAADVIIVVSSVVPGLMDALACEALADVGADLVAIAGGSFNYGDAVVQAPRAAVREAAIGLRDRGARVMIECFEVGHVDEALTLNRDRHLTSPVRVQVVLGVPGGLGASDEAIRCVATRMANNAQWFMAGVGRHQRKTTELAVRLGGNVRVGLADNIYLRRGVLAEGSAPMVDRLASFARTVGREPAAVDRARVLLKMAPAAEATGPADAAVEGAPEEAPPVGPSESRPAG